MDTRKGGKESSGLQSGSPFQLLPKRRTELEEFLANIKVLTATLGHRIFESLEETMDTKETPQQIFFVKMEQEQAAREAFRQKVL